MDCKDFSDEELLNMLKSDSESVVTRVINCFNNLFYNEFLKVSWKVVFNKRNYSKIFREHIERDAFNDGLNEFYFFVRDGKYEYGQASLQTVFLNFCKFKLMGKIKTEERMMVREVRGNADEIIERSNMHTAPWEETKEKEDMEEGAVHIFNTAWQNLGERCRNLLTWRKFQKLSNEEIEKLCGISAEVVNNEVYRCFMRLKKMAGGLMYNPN